MKQQTNLKRNLLFNTAGNLIYFFCQWLITGLLVKVLSPEETGVINTGILATAMAASNMFLTLSSYGMRNFQVSDTGKYSDTTYIRSRYLTFSVSVLLCFGTSLVLGYRGTQLVAIILWLLYKLVESLTDVYHGCAQKTDRMDVIGISYAVRGVMSVLVFAAVMLISGNIIHALLALAVSSYLFSVWYDIARNLKFVNKSAEKESFKPVFALLLECLPLAVYSFLSTTSASVPRLMLERICGTELMGIFNLVNSPVMILQVGIAFLFSPFVGTFTGYLSDGNTKGFIKTTGVITAVVFGLGVVAEGGVLLLGRFGLRLLYGSEIAEYSYLLPPMVLTAVLTCVSIFYCMLLTILRDMKGLIISNAAGIAASFAASLILIPHLDMVGAALAASAALLCQCICLALFGLKDLKNR